jgi:hypothetical protein
VTGAIRCFINNWTKNQHHPLQSSSPVKPHSAKVIVLTPGSSAGRIHVEVPSASLSWRFGCCPHFQNDNLRGGIWVLGKERSHMDSNQVSMGLWNHWNTHFDQNFVHRDGIVTGSIVVMQHPSVRMPNSLVKMSWTVWWFKFNSLLIILTVKCRSDLTRVPTLVTFSSIFDVQSLPEQGSSFTISRPSNKLSAT